MTPTPYTVTTCIACENETALVIEPPRYICLGCGETGTVHARGANVPDRRPDPTLAVVLAGIIEAEPSKVEFQALCRKHALKVKLRGIPGGRRA